jgi:hypothetical protein
MVQRFINENTNSNETYSSIKVRRHQNRQIKELIKRELTNEAIQDFFKVFFASHLSIKIFWTISIVISVGLCSYLVIQSILTYMSYGVNTTTRNIVENPTDFPRITICMLNFFLTL